MRSFNTLRGVVVGVGAVFVMLVPVATASAVRLQLNYRGSPNPEGRNMTHIAIGLEEGTAECQWSYLATNNNDRGTITDVLTEEVSSGCSNSDTTGPGFSAVKLSWNGSAKTVGEATITQAGCTYRFRKLAATAEPPFSVTQYLGSATGVLQRKGSLLTCPGALVASNVLIRVVSAAQGFNGQSLLLIPELLN